MMRGRGEARSSMEAQTKQPNECCFCQRKEFEINNGIIITCQVVRVGCNLGTQSGDVVMSEPFLQAGVFFALFV